VDLEAELVLGKDGADLAQYALEPATLPKPSTSGETERSGAKPVAGSGSAPAGAPSTKAKPAAKGKKANGPSTTGPTAKVPEGDNVAAGKASLFNLVFY
jgi:hypothetical protein